MDPLISAAYILLSYFKDWLNSCILSYQLNPCYLGDIQGVGRTGKSASVNQLLYWTECEEAYPHSFLFVKSASVDIV
jgi:hypothetical protein